MLTCVCGDLASASAFYLALLRLSGSAVRVDIGGWLQFEAPGPHATSFLGVAQDKDHRPNGFALRSGLAPGSGWTNLPPDLPGSAR